MILAGGGKAQSHCEDASEHEKLFILMKTLSSVEPKDDDIRKLL